MAGIADVAELAGVSKSTASRALSGRGYVSDETQTRVRDAAERLGYVPSTTAVSLATGRTDTVGVIMPAVNRWFFGEVLEGIQTALVERGLDLALYNAKPGTPGRARIFDHYLARQRFDGVIAVGLEPADHEMERLHTIGRPIVTVVGSSPGASAIAIDDLYAARRATEHLLALGHRRIAFVGGAQELHWAHVDKLRLQGYQESMIDAGLEEYIRHIPAVLSLPGGYAASVDFLGDTRRRPTAIVGVCDEVAIGAIIAARRIGVRVPSDLSVVGIDDHEHADMFSLTTLRQSPRAQGYEAVQLLIAQMEDPGAPPRHIAASSRLIVRNSTGPADRESSAIEAGTSLG
ncbi:transcriptional regulator [Microbacterium sp. Root61]|uniref:LacI family DNA-binding transcriptional regulator n=1 Tax=Microbacterium sp. Root61 TaxID=1736570 RepID=UPI0006F953F1|nr:LacI family DNA-binding transcriptional regulator [Microbacterium sp. Root61]KRA24254.1 transcriptional regulator [Microbacterium sp. Root61]